MFLLIAILTRVRWNLNVFFISISFIARTVEHFFTCFLTFGLFPLKKLCSVHLLISSLVHWFFGSLVFWGPCIFWLSNRCQMYSCQRFSSILWAASLVWWLFAFLCRNFLVSCSPICQHSFLVTEPLEFYLWSYCLFLYVPCIPHSLLQ
jgi:hypothetical protein